MLSWGRKGDSKVMRGEKYLTVMSLLGSEEEGVRKCYLVSDLSEQDLAHQVLVSLNIEFTLVDGDTLDLHLLMKKLKELEMP